MKRCVVCNEEKELTDYYSRIKQSGAIYYTPQCKVCYRIRKRANYIKNADYIKRRERRYQQTHSEQLKDADLKKKYGISLEEYYQLSANQNHVCAVCSSKCTKYKNLSVDHCHTTGKIRGLLCNNCNRGIGLLKDTFTNVRNAAAYLEKAELVEIGPV